MYSSAPEQKKEVYKIPKRSVKKEDKERKKSLTSFYDEMLNKAPFKCQECGDNLISSTVINPRTIVAHILPKSKFKSIECNEDNILYLCYKCHHNFDNKGKDYVLKMKLLPTIKVRLKILKPLILKSEYKGIPDYLENLT